MTTKKQAEYKTPDGDKGAGADQNLLGEVNGVRNYRILQKGNRYKVQGEISFLFGLFKVYMDYGRIEPFVGWECIYHDSYKEALNIVKEIIEQEKIERKGWVEPHH